MSHGGVMGMARAKGSSAAWGMLALPVVAAKLAPFRQTVREYIRLECAPYRNNASPLGFERGFKYCRAVEEKAVGRPLAAQDNAPPLVAQCLIIPHQASNAPPGLERLCFALRLAAAASASRQPPTTSRRS
jgi:hypothetical protein